MKSRIIVIIITIALAGIVAMSCLYIIDMSRMKNNESVIFSTWGYDYAPQEDTSEPPLLNLVNSSGDILATCLKSTYDWSYGNGTVFSDYPHPVNRAYDENNILRCVQGTEIFIDSPNFQINSINLYRHNVSDKLKYNIQHTNNSICVDMPDDEEYIMEIITQHKQGKVAYCIKIVEVN